MWLLLVLIGFVGTAAGLAYWLFWPSTDRLLQEGRQAYDSGDVVGAKHQANRVLERDPDNVDGLLLAAEASVYLQQPLEVVAYCSRIANDGSAKAIYARNLAGHELLVSLKRLSDAEAQCRAAVEMDFNDADAHARLAFILGVGRRSWEAVPHRLMMIRLDRMTLTQMDLLAMSSTAVENAVDLPGYIAAAPEDPIPRFAHAQAQFKMDRQKHKQSIEMLRELVKSHGQLAAIQEGLGEMLVEFGTDQEFVNWYVGVPESAKSLPGFWNTCGKFASRLGEPSTAARCYWEAMRLDPDNSEISYRLGQTLIALSRIRDATPFLQRARSLNQYLYTVLVAKRGDVSQMRNAAETARRLGMLHEAYGWAFLAQAQNAKQPWAVELCRELKPVIADLPLQRTIESCNPAHAIDLSSLPLPDWRRVDVLATDGVLTRSVSRSKVRFEDNAEAAGIRFHYYCGREQVEMIYETMGGGAAIFDYDLDGWPDIYLTQGSRWPPDQNQSEFTDRLFRNLGNGRFGDVTAEAGIHENAYSQGVTVGDFNVDGFPDLYVSNIGANRFYRNNGDGTFSDVTAQTETAGWRWSTSCLLADLNGDNLPDLYVANFLAGDEVFTRVCQNRSGKPSTCLPNLFPGAQDDLYLNLGDGRFREVAASAGVAVDQPGKGLGAVAADFDGSGRLSLFIANDVGANFYFVNQTEFPGADIKYSEQALLRGLAVNGKGSFEACMGVAAGDANGDGRIELFATNFQAETNTLYSPVEGGLFNDITDAAGLAEPSINLLGFGTQFVDGDLDGDLDLIVTNGHVNDERESGNPYEMRPQYFQNDGTGRFTELFADQLGPFFQGEYLGRGMARLDWNRDGKEDVVISHLHHPVALLTNTTENVGHHLTVELRGVDCPREAIGTIVTARIGERTLTRHLTAGDGYLASNERKLVFGLGEQTSVDELEIRWITGEPQTFHNLAADAEYIFVQNSDRPFIRRNAFRSSDASLRP